MRIWLAKVRRQERIGLIPTDDKSHAAIKRLADGECVEVDLSRPRSIKWHKMYFGICSNIGENQDPQRNESSIDYEVRVLAGHYDVMYVGKSHAASFLASILPIVLKVLPAAMAIQLRELIADLARGHEVRIPKRIAFHKLSADEWAVLWPSLELAIRERFGDEYIREQAA